MESPFRFLSVRSRRDSREGKKRISIISLFIFALLPFFSATCSPGLGKKRKKRKGGKREQSRLDDLSLLSTLPVIAGRDVSAGRKKRKEKGVARRWNLFPVMPSLSEADRAGGGEGSGGKRGEPPDSSYLPCSPFGEGGGKRMGEKRRKVGLHPLPLSSPSSRREKGEDKKGDRLISLASI